MKHCKNKNCPNVNPQPLDNFFNDKSFASGKMAICKTCKQNKTYAWRKKNKDRYNAEMREWRKNNPLEVKDYDLRRCYGIGLDRYNGMKEEQKHVCAICENPPKGKRPLVVDHRHSDGKVRGLLCYGCNRALHVLESIDLLQKAQEYLLKHK